MYLKKAITILFLSGIIWYAHAQIPELVLQNGHTKQITAISFDHDGKHMITRSDDRTSKIWDPFNGLLISDFNNNTIETGSVSGQVYYDADNRYVMESRPASEPYYEYVYDFWDPVGGKIRYTIKGGSLSSINPGGGVFAVAWKTKNEILIYNTTTGKPVTKLMGLGYEWLTSNICFITDSTLLVCNYKYTDSLFDASLFYTLYNVNSKTVIGTFADESPHFNTNTLIPGNTGKYVLSYKKGPDVSTESVVLWDMVTLQPVWTKQVHDATYLQFNWDDSKILSACYGLTNDYADGKDQSSIAEFSVKEEGKLSVFTRTKKGKVLFLKYSPGGHLIAMASSADMPNNISDSVIPYTIGIYDQKYHLISSTPSVNKMITAAAFTQDEKYIVTGYADGSFITWDIAYRVARKLTQNESVLDHIVQMHYNKSSGKLLYLTEGNYCSMDEQLFSDKKNIPYLDSMIEENLEGNYFGTLKPAIHQLGNDKYSIITNQHMVKLMDNEALSLLGSLENGFNDSLLLKSMQIEHPEIKSFTIEQKQVRDRKGHQVSDTLSENSEILETKLLHASVQSDKGEYKTVLSSKYGRYNPDYRHNVKTNSYLFPTIDGTNHYQIDDKLFILKGKLSNANLQNPVLSTNGEYLFGEKKHEQNTDYSSNAMVYCVSVPQGQIVNSFSLNRNELFNADFANPVFSPDSATFCIYNTKGNDIFIKKKEDGKDLHQLQGTNGTINGVEYSKDSKYLFSWTADGTCQKWDVKSGNKLYTFLFFSDQDYAVILPDGYYYISSHSDTKYLNFKLNGRLYNFAQFDLQLNRPDLVLKQMGSRDTALIHLYYKAWLDRLQTMGYQEKDFAMKVNLHIPEVVMHTDSFRSVTKERELPLGFLLTDSLFNITAYTIYVNDVPVNGKKGTRLPHLQKKDTVSTTVLLSEGENKIEVNCINEKGALSRKEVVFINYEPVKPAKSKTLFIGIGINNYHENPYFENLQFCVKDIQDLSAAFTAKFGNDFVVDTLLNDNATQANILALKERLLKTGVEDKVIISISGHGMTFKNDFYFVTGITDANHPELEGVSYTQLEDLLDSIPARKKLLLLDACHSGEQPVGMDGLTLTSAAKPIVTGIHNKGNLMNFNQQNTSSVNIIDVQQDPPPKALLAAGSVNNIFKLMKDAFVDIRRNNGAYVISAAQSYQTAAETEEMENGIFTYALLQILQQNQNMTVNDLNIKINRMVNQKTAGSQNTDNRQELADFNWQLW